MLPVKGFTVPWRSIDGLRGAEVRFMGGETGVSLGWSLGFGLVSRRSIDGFPFMAS
ncbi:MAG: hypothetical protein ACO4AI_02540 [Prochlorothrix sp.]|nr:hypothetical protein [Prochlorothrix sp.]